MEPVIGISRCFQRRKKLRARYCLPVIIHFLATHIHFTDSNSKLVRSLRRERAREQGGESHVRAKNLRSGEP